MALGTPPATLVKQAIVGRLLADPDLVAGLSTYEGLPAVFASRTVPVSAELPWVHVRPVAQTADDDLVEHGLIFLTDLGVFATDPGSTDTADALAGRVRTLFHHQPLPTSAGSVVAVQASQVLDTPDEPLGVVGRIVSLTIRYRE